MRPEFTKELIQRLTALKSCAHMGCDDPWYACPKSEDGCANQYEESACTCGADDRNAEIDVFLAWIAVQ